jgi:hypothetical protein
MAKGTKTPKHELQKLLFPEWYKILVKQPLRPSTQEAVDAIFLQGEYPISYDAQEHPALANALPRIEEEIMELCRYIPLRTTQFIAEEVKATEGCIGWEVTTYLSVVALLIPDEKYSQKELQTFYANLMREIARRRDLRNEWRLGITRQKSIDELERRQHGKDRGPERRQDVRRVKDMINNLKD